MFKKSFIAVVAAASVVVAAASPNIKWNKTLHQFGSFSEDLETVTCTFVGINDGDEPLVIYDVKSNCGCTTTEKYSGNTYAPGDTIKISATYSASGRPGRFSKKLMVFSNAQPEKQSLTLTGTVVGSTNTLRGRYPVEAGNIRLSGQTAMLGQAKKGRTASSFIRAYNTTTDTLAPIVENVPKFMNVIVEPEKVIPGEQFIVSFTYHTGQNSRWGLQTDTIALLPIPLGGSPESVEPIELTSIVTINEDFSRLTPEQRADAPKIAVTPPTIDLQRIKKDAPRSTHQVKITNNGKSQLIIRQLSTVHPSLKTDLSETKIKPGKSATLTVTVDPQANTNPDLIDGRITIIANDPDQPTTLLRVVGEILK